MVSLPESLIVRPIVLWVPWAGRQGRGAQLNPHNPRGNDQWCATSLEQSQVYGAGWDPPEGTEGSGITAHQSFTNSPGYAEKSQLLVVSKCEAQLQGGTRRMQGGPQPDVRAGEGHGADHPEVVPLRMCGIALGSGLASTGLWKATPAWSIWLPSMTRWPV